MSRPDPVGSVLRGPLVLGRVVSILLGYTGDAPAALDSAEQTHGAGSLLLLAEEGQPAWGSHVLIGPGCWTSFLGCKSYPWGVLSALGSAQCLGAE